MLDGPNVPDSPDAAKRYTVTLVDTEAEGAVSVKYRMLNEGGS